MTFDCSGWFKTSPSMTAGPSTPPRFFGFANFTGAPSVSRTIHWGPLPPPSAPSVSSQPSENPNATSPEHRFPCEHHPAREAMAYLRADPRPFIPHGTKPMEIPTRKQMERVVMTRPRAKNHDLAIVTTDPLPQHQVTFQAIRDVVSDFLTNERRIDFTDMQPTHLGQAFVRFRRAFDRDKMIQLGPIRFGNVTLTFVEHNKGRNWRAFNFNMECWLMLLGFPPDFRENEYIVNTISSFGRVISWLDDIAHLGRLLVRACVADYETVPQLLVLTEGEDFHGESWTVQCEILQVNLPEGLPSNEDPAPGPDDFPPGGTFDLFGFGQQGLGPALHQNQENQQIGPQPFFGEIGGQADQALEGTYNWDSRLDNEQEVQGLDLNELPEDPLIIDLNAPPDLQEVIIDPVVIIQQQDLDLDDLLNEVNEGEKDVEEEQADQNATQNVVVQDPINPPEVEGNLPVLNHPMQNSLQQEIQENDLMAVQEMLIENNAVRAQGNPQGPQNFHWVGQNC